MRRRPIPIIPFALALAMAQPGVGWTQTAEQGAALARALEQARAESWTGASAAAAEARDQVAADIVLWLRLQEDVGGWEEFRRFLSRNPDWPREAEVRRNAERAMPEALPPQEVVAFFDGAAAVTGTGALRHAGALRQGGRGPEAQEVVLRSWREDSMRVEEQAAFVADYGPVVTPHVTERLDMLLWQGLTEQARALLPLAPADWRALAEARIGVREDVNGTTALIEAVPDDLKRDPGLAYERYLYRLQAGRWDDAEAFLLTQSISAEALGKPDTWMERRPQLARAALRRGDPKAAYDLAARNFGTQDGGANYADAEWLAGYIALTRLDDPARAAAHFERFGAVVNTPISLGRAGYWLGLAFERSGDEAAAQAAYAAGARHQTSFYGQLAAQRIGADIDPRLAGESEAPNWRDAGFMASSVVRAGHLLALAGDDARAALFLRHAANGMDAADRASLAQMAIDLGRPHIGVRIAKDAAAKGMLLPNQYYPVNAMARAEWPIPTELALAIARQESEFNPEATSPAGALGLMQLMPGTAADVARDLRLGYEPGRLTTDPMYNARLGTAYLARMLKDFGGSYVLAAAAYNAGPRRVDQWLAVNGDPRGAGVDPIGWIEAIPFEETRNYVMRVLESLHVYRARLQGSAPPIRLAFDIERTG